ncbi:RNA 3'-terminal phosphate cyclase domain-containing protein [Emericellopsis atlantica]|uniref:RNA 3'-terminal phosphate cyclase domain-containing protein n=1 Tax=Emericellopsis atlantica TaxID=2614577 RepID=A0A9P8CLT3_9HYPO|nr:RNA 3'-terminal phosphate cyclase domain-containing protein [Emericellopsis atlantica]KAG9251382.1 RNA 3'-terminal phosphate cyclase domain-containing protein [Emericellopsis atlantica]
MAKLIHIDGRTGEGGGQLVRLAIGLSAVTTRPVKIANIRGNRPSKGSSGGGLKNQHVTSIRWLADVTEADVEGLRVGSTTLTFIPRRKPSQLVQRNFKITAESGAASTLLILQAILPFCVFAGNESNEPVVLDIVGGTNVSFSLSYEYLDQVLLPTLEDRFGIVVERQLKSRAWSLGSSGKGEITIKVHPLQPKQALQFRTRDFVYPTSWQLKSVNVTIITPSLSHSTLQVEIVARLEQLFPTVDITFKATEDSGNVARWYILLVATSTDGLRWGHDILVSMPKKTKSPDKFAAQVAQQVCKGLDKEIQVRGQVDEHLQDQIVCFQGLCSGLSSMPRGSLPTETPSVSVDEQGFLSANIENMRREKGLQPFGHGSLHTQTAHWIVKELLPEVQFFAKGDVVQGIGWV